MSRVTKAPDERRNELILTAQHLFFTKGYDRTSISDIVKGVGVAKGTFYHYFDSKTAVLEAIIETLADESLTIMRTIINDTALTALEKWHKAFMTLGDWKVTQKQEVLEIARLLMHKDNIVLSAGLSKEIAKRVSVELAKIIVQGTEEGVFTTDYPHESAKMILGINLAFRDEITAISLEPDNYDDPVGTARHKFTAVQTAFERILLAPQGSLAIVDDAILKSWYQ